MEKIEKSKLTSSQELAVSSDAAQVVVLAGAGSGKTRVLVERYLRLILQEGIPPGRILAATFTDKAAAELKERAAVELEKLGKPELIAELNTAPICTLHSFCSRLIAPQSLQMGLDPGYQVLDSYQARLLQEEVLTQALTRWRKDHPERVQTIINGLSWSDERQPRPGRSPASKGFARQFLELVDAVRCAGKSEEPLFIPLQADPEKNRSSAKQLGSELAAILNNFKSKITPASLKNSEAVLNNLDQYLSLSGKSKAVILPIQNLIRINLNVSAHVKGILKRIRAELAPALLEEYYADAYQAVCAALNSLFVDFLAEYRLCKLNLGVLDFLDLEEIALQILRSRKFSPPVDHILIDEAQDLNFVQWEIIKNLHDAGIPVFAVGDMQQSIYGFRHADVKLFAEFADSAQKHGDQPLTLPENFRSRSIVLSIINRLFEAAWSELDNVPFLRLEAKFPYTPQAEEGVELIAAYAADRQSARSAEAQALVQRIGELVRNGDFLVYELADNSDSSESAVTSRRPIWSDVLVLVRSGSSFQYLENAFREAGIPLVVLAGRGFWDAIEISDLLALLAVFEDPYDSFSLACVLRSPAAGFTDDDLLALRVAQQQNQREAADPFWKLRPLYQGLVELADPAAPPETLGWKAAHFKKIFDDLYRLKDRLLLRDLLELWIEKTGLETIWAEAPQGDLIRSNVRKFLRLCDTQSGKTPAQLRAAFEEIRSRELREGIAPDPLSSQGAVSALTVHAAKGLEAPIVAIFDMNYEPHSSGNALIYSRNSGAAFDLLTENDEIYKSQTVAKIEVASKISQREEEQRVLYVAMTRAREKLLLTASCTKDQADERDKKIRIAGWFKLLTEQLDLDLNAILTDDETASDAAPLINSCGEDTKILLRRAWRMPPVVEKMVDLLPPGTSAKQQVPTGFPAPAQPGFGPISVVDWLRQAEKSSGKVFCRDEEWWDDELEETRGAPFGRWVHRMLQILPDHISEIELHDLAAYEAELLFNRLPTEAELAKVMLLLDNFNSSPLALRLRQSRRVLREYPILFELKNTLLRGKLDLTFEADDGWIIVDYKSDRLMQSELSQNPAIYENQLRLYALGWQKLTGRMPQEALIFYLDPNLIQSVPLDSVNLNTALQMIPG